MISLMIITVLLKCFLCLVIIAPQVTLLPTNADKYDVLKLSNLYNKIGHYPQHYSSSDNDYMIKLYNYEHLKDCLQLSNMDPYLKIPFYRNLLLECSKQITGNPSILFENSLHFLPLMDHQNRELPNKRNFDEIDKTLPSFSTLNQLL